MKLIHLLLMCAMMTLMVACNTTPPATTSAPATSKFTAQVEYGCAGASAAVKALTVAAQAGKLSTTTKAQVSKALTVTNPVCLAPEPPTMTQVEYNLFLSSLQYLQRQSQALGSKP